MIRPTPATWTARHALLAVCLLLIVDGAATALSLLDFIWAGLPLHFGATLSVFVLAWRHSGARSAETATLRLTTLLAPSLGPIAILPALIILAVQAVSGAVTADADAWYDHLFPKMSGDNLSTDVEMANRRGSAGDDLADMASFHDVIRWGSFAEKEHVLTLIGRSFRPEFAPVLRETLSGDDPGLRAQAAIGLSSLEERFSARLDHARARYQTAPGSSMAILELVDILADGAHSGLFDEDRTTRLREEIVEILGPSFAAHPNAAVGARLGRTFILLDRLDQAVDVLERVLTLEPDNIAAFTWLLEALFRRRAFASLFQLLQQKPERATELIALDGPLAPTLQMWMQAA